jgi:3-oxoacyl-[acyl-carrier protein] reductase
MHQFDLTGRRAVVTGGAQGIGRAIAERLLRSGARVSVWDCDPRSSRRPPASSERSAMYTRRRWTS